MRLFLSLLTAALIGAAASADEPSAFDAGNLDTPNPYGLSDDQKHILRNKRAIERLQKQVLKQQQTIEHNREQIEGLRSIIEGLDEKLRTLDTLSSKADTLDQKTASLQESQKESLDEIRNVLKELGSMIDSINAKYVDKGRFDRLENAFLSFKKSYESYSRKRRTATGSSLKGKSKAQIFAEAKKLYNRRALTKAKESFAYLAKHRYKPATSNYYLGEIAYREGRYRDAIAHYKKSASLYSKSSFMPNLLLHTGIALHRIGDRKQAKQFYRSLIDLYPKSKEAGIAKSRLSKMK